MNRFALLFFCFVCSVAYVPAQDLEDTPSWSPKEVPKRPKEVDKATAKAKIKAFQAAMKTANNSEAKLKAAQALFDTGYNVEFTKEFAKVLGKEKDFLVRRKVAEFLCIYRDDKASKALIKVIKDKKNHEEIELLNWAGRALGMSTKKSVFKVLEKEFRKATGNNRRAMILAWGESKDWAAIRFLGEWLEKPMPGNPNSPSNPPASYWQQRHMEWRQVQKQVEWALYNITGKVFYSKTEVRRFLKANPKPPKKKEKKKSK